MADTAIETLESKETPAAAVDEVKIPTLAETEAAWKAEQAREMGPEFAKRFPDAVKTVTKEEPKKEEPKAEEKKAEAAKEEPKKEAVKEEPKPKTGFGKAIRRAVDRAVAEHLSTISALKTEVEALKGGKKDEPAVVALVEPKVEDFPKIEDYIKAVRAYDKAVAAEEKKQTTTTRESSQADALWNAKVQKYNTELREVEKKYPDWPEKRDKANVSIGREKDDEYNTLMAGILMDAGPETIYQLVSKPSEARQLSKLDATGLIAASNSEDLSSVLLWLAGHPEDIRALNGLSPVKAQNYVGKIEAKIELAAKAAPSEKKVEPKAEEVKKEPSSGADTTQSTKTEKGADATEDKAEPKAKSDPPPALRGVAPSGSSWKDSEPMSLEERERRYHEDVRNKRR